MKGTITSILNATPKPNSKPANVPITPTVAPCTTKMPMMLLGLAPKVRKMAISARLSCTVITKVDTKLNAATATISVKIMNIMRFSTCTAANQVLFCRVQSRTTKLPVKLRLKSRATARASCKSLSFNRMPVGPSRRNILAASSTCIIASVESYSKCPESKVPTTTNCFMRGVTPAGVT